MDFLTLAGQSPVYYPEQYAKSDTTQISPCSRNFIKGKCSQGHTYLKSIVCGKEYCPTCGKNDSDIHQRRKARWWPKLFSLEKVGYLVLTIPVIAREKFKDREALKEFRTFVRRKLIREGYKQGLIRWHWFGDCKVCKGKGCQECEGTGAGRQWNPHLNIFINQGYMTEKIFQEFTANWKNSVMKWIRDRWKDIPGHTIKGNVHFKFCSNDRQKGHKLNYVTRSTFRIYDRAIAKLLHGFRNSVSFGKFEKCKKESENNELISLENGLCPCCGDRIIWLPGLIKRKSIPLWCMEKISGGYYLFKPELKPETG